ncbi:hypothetical protein GCM10025868_00880 [Angustibacter aerolatus]|uniref:Uncharacterized protein n=1 Tax=Angustibacter aerolatus TaxID=1162965 RepID=A0ABQ6J9H9_9ACTN|nr:hypothetical protein GCM10025868_00880 [Angustibacter aerolatus]
MSLFSCCTFDCAFVVSRLPALGLRGLDLRLGRRDAEGVGLLLRLRPPDGVGLEVDLADAEAGGLADRAVLGRDALGLRGGRLLGAAGGGDGGGDAAHVGAEGGLDGGGGARLLLPLPEEPEVVPVLQAATSDVTAAAPMQAVAMRRADI